MIDLSSHQIRRILRYVFFVSFILWIIISILIIYNYVRFSSASTTNKGGTFVEGIFDSTSYLPYLRNDEQSNFYQGLLFNSCLKYVINKDGSKYQEDLCTVSTKDNKIYNVDITKGAIWSDGTPLTIEDILFTYQEILIKNKWNIRNLGSYKDIKITIEGGNKFKVEFPSATVDNRLFFTNYILPKHILADFNFQSYREIFSVQPTYTNCANIVSQTTDQYSLIFNLINCKNTNLNFYQIKNLISIDSFSQNITEKGSSIVDVYIGDKTLPGYQLEKLQTNKLVTLFFNTNSKKLRVRTRRALGGLIKHNFYSSGYEQYLIKNTDGLFDVFMSTGGNIKDFLSTSYQEDSVMKKDLLDSGIKPLTNEITVKNENQKFVFYVENNNINQGLSVNLNTIYDKIIVDHNGKSSVDKNFIPNNKKTSFWIGGKGGDFTSGLNKYTIQGWVKGTKKTIATVDIYNLSPVQTATNTSGTNDTGGTETIEILYYNTPLYKNITNNIKTIFEKQGVSNYFSFQSINTVEELEGRLLLGDYDIVINTIDMGLKKDMQKIFATDSAKVNPSQYKNTRLVSLLQQYTTSYNSKTLNEINNNYSKDMPFVILGKAFVPMQIKKDLSEKVFGSGSKMVLYDYNWRNVLYEELKLVSNIHIDGKRIFNYTNFSEFIVNALGLDRTKQEDSVEELIINNLGTENISGSNSNLQN